MLYKNCRELPMHNFNEIEVTNDLTNLIKDKEKHEQSELELHWIDILEEYLNLSKDNSQKKFFRDRAELLFLETKLTILNAFVNIVQTQLTTAQKKEFDSILKAYKVKDIPQAILETTDKINIKISRFNKEYKSEKSGTFETTLASIRMNGIHVNRHDITVSEWIALLNQMKQRASENNAKKRKR